MYKIENVENSYSLYSTKNENIHSCLAIYDIDMKINIFTDVLDLEILV